VSAAALQFGVFLIPGAEDPERTVERATAAERLGLDLIGVQDHPYQRRFLDTFTLLAYVAARTTRIKLVTDVANLPLRPPAPLAKAAATIDLLSQGRFELGLGAGGFADAIHAMGGPRLTPKESVDALEEAIPIIRQFWSSPDRLDHDGGHYQLHGLKPGPQPAHPIGIWLGAYGPRMMRITGRLADGWLPSIPNLPLDEITAKHDQIDEAATRAGRDPSAIRRVANVAGVITDGDSDGFLKGPADQWVEDLRRLHEQYRFDSFIFWGEGDADEQLKRFAEDVVPRARERVAS
jgi:alkanesulfonate monooxygenase SsuD/methylene tetrahydromethanopterin reductase-like flavin-dependent oxidoreductase (luciferase family)